MFHASAIVVERVSEQEWHHIEGEWKQRSRDEESASEGSPS
jgi:hypothetical protein